MPNLIGLGAGASAAACAVALGVAFWPPMDKAPATARAAIVQPVFVVKTAAQVPPAGGAPHAASATPAAGSDSAALAKLAVALKTDPSTTAGHPGATRSLARSATTPPVSEAARQLCAQGLVALAAGDIAGARLILDRAAEAGDARALMALGASYDPATLAKMGARGVKGDAPTARLYYAKALAAGMGAARERMAALDAP
jgi:hypothetical protein